MADPRISFVVVMDENRLMGRGGAVPWVLPDDLAWFRRHTVGKPTVMGRKTYDSLPERFRPLPDRLNIVVTRDPDYHAPGAMVVHSPEQALASVVHGDEIMVVGGGQLFEALLPRADRIYLTLVQTAATAAPAATGDVYFPELEPGEWLEGYCEEHPADERHAHAFTWQILDRYRPA